ncbi:MAG: anti-sigma factor [Betaproteobacteria bacterium]
MSPLPLSDEDVHAYVDGRLAPARAAAFEEALAHDTGLAARIAELRRQNATLREAFDPWIDEPVPQRLVDAARPPARADRWRRFAPHFAAAATLVLGVALGWFARETLLERDGTPTTFARQAALTHVLYASDANRPVEIWAAEEQRLVRWLSRRLNYAVHAPDLNSFGYALVGGRLVAGNQKPAAMFIYENGDKQRLSLMVRKRPGEGETAFRYAVENGIGVYYWVDDNCAYALSGQVDRAQMLAIGRLVYGQLAAADAASAHQGK